jgi:hypothetical protein
MLLQWPPAFNAFNAVGELQSQSLHTFLLNTARLCDSVCELPLLLLWFFPETFLSPHGQVRIFMHSAAEVRRLQALNDHDLGPSLNVANIRNVAVT